MQRSAGTSRRIRQQTEIFSAIHNGRTSHALDLAFEHLEEFGSDRAIVQALASAVDIQHTPALSVEFEALLRRLEGHTDSQNSPDCRKLTPRVASSGHRHDN